MLPLDNILDELNAGLGRSLLGSNLLPPPALLKIDCEGCEWHVLSGLARHLSEGWLPGVIVLETITGFVRSVAGERAADPLDGAHSVRVSSATMLMRFIPLGYRVWTGDMAEELTPQLVAARALEEPASVQPLTRPLPCGAALSTFSALQGCLCLPRQ